MNHEEFIESAFGTSCFYSKSIGLILVYTVSGIFVGTGDYFILTSLR